MKGDILLWSGVAVILLVGGYFVYKYIQDKPISLEGDMIQLTGEHESD